MNGRNVNAGEYVLRPVQVVKKNGDAFLTQGSNCKLVLMYFADCYPLPKEGELALTVDDLLGACLEFTEYYSGLKAENLIGTREGWRDFLQKWLTDLRQYKENT